VFLELIRKLKAPICELEFALSTKRVIGLIGTEESCPMIVEINSNLIDGQTRPSTLKIATRQKVEGSTRVPGLPIRDCARGCNHRGQSRPIMSAIDVTAKTFFERLYLVLELRKIVLCVSCPYAPTTLPIHIPTISRFLRDFFPWMAPQFFGYTIHQVIWLSHGTLGSTVIRFYLKILRFVDKPVFCDARL